MGLLGGNTDNNPAIQLEKIDVGTKTMNLIRIIDWETEVILYTDTTRDGYTSVPFHETGINPDDAPDHIKKHLESE